MVHGVISHNMPLCYHTAHQIGILLNVVAHQEKGGWDLVLFQYIQDLPGTAVFIACVKGQINDLFLGVSQIGGMKPGQLLAAGRADGRGIFLPEAKAPGAGLDRFGEKLGKYHSGHR